MITNLPSVVTLRRTSTCKQLRSY